MLKGSFSGLSGGSKFIMLLLLVMSFLLLSMLFGFAVLIAVHGPAIVPSLSSPDYSNPAIVGSLKVMQIINMALGMLLPTLLFLWLSTPGVKSYTGMNLHRPVTLFILAIVLILASQPIIGFTNDLNSRLALPQWLSGIEKWMQQSEESGKLVTEAFLSTTSAGGLLVNIFMIALLPAVAEEFLFRGALLGIVRGWSKNAHLAVVLSALIFSAIHLQFYGFVPRFLLGLGLGYLYLWSGSIWLPVAAHFTNNFLAVAAEFLYRRHIIPVDADSIGTADSWWLIALCSAAVTVLLYMIYRLSKKKKESYATLQ